MATLKPIVHKRRLRLDGTFNVQIRLYHDSQLSHIPTPYYVTKKQMTPDLDRFKDDVVEDAINLMVSSMRKEIFNLGSKIHLYSAKTLASYLENKNSGKASNVDFFEYAEKIIEQTLQEKRISTASSYKAMRSNLTRFCKNQKLDILNINSQFLRNYEYWLRVSEGMGSRGIESNLVSLRTIFRKARMYYNNEEIGDVLIPNNPFEYYSIPKSKAPEKRALSIEELKRIRDYEYVPDKYAKKAGISRVELARDVFMLSFYTVGTNSIDLFNLDTIKNGRMEYCRSKTKDRRDDRAFISIKLEPEAMEIIDKYRNKRGKKVLSFYQRYSSAANFNIHLNKGLKRIGEDLGIPNLQFYAARHTWGTLLVNECGYSESDAAFALNHVSEHKVTSRYIKKDFTRIDRMNRDVVDLK